MDPFRILEDFYEILTTKIKGKKTTIQLDLSKTSNSQIFYPLLLIDSEFLINETLIESYANSDFVSIRYINKDISVPIPKGILRVVVNKYIEKFKQYEGFGRWYLTYSLVI